MSARNARGSYRNARVHLFARRVFSLLVTLDFMFQLAKKEFDGLRRHFGTSSSWGGRRYPPYASRCVGLDRGIRRFHAEYTLAPRPIRRKASGGVIFLRCAGVPLPPEYWIARTTHDAHLDPRDYRPRGNRS